MKLFIAALLFVSSSAAFADGVQVCVDSAGSTYTARVTGFAKKNSDWSAIVSGQGAIAPGTDLNRITFKGGLADVSTAEAEDLYYKLKPLVTPTFQQGYADEVSLGYEDEPRIYESSGVTLLCSSTMSQSEYEALAK